MPSSTIQFSAQPADTVFVQHRPMFGYALALDGYDQVFVTAPFVDPDDDLTGISVTGYTVTFPDGSTSDTAPPPFNLSFDSLGSGGGVGEALFVWQGFDDQFYPTLALGQSMTVTAHVRIEDASGAFDTEDIRLILQSPPSNTITSGQGLALQGDTSPLVVDWSDKTDPVSGFYDHDPANVYGLAYLWSQGDQAFPFLTNASFSAPPPGMDIVIYDNPTPIDLKTGSGADHLIFAEASATVDAGAGDDFISGSTAGDVLMGGDGDDVIHGETANVAYPVTGAQDFIYGGAGNDTLEGGPGDDVIDGGSGVDTAVFYGPSSNYSISIGGSNVIVTEITPNPDRPEGQDTLTNVEKLQFSDQTIDLANPLTLVASAPSATLVEAGTGVAGVATASVTLSAIGASGAASFQLPGATALGGGLYALDGSYGRAVLDTNTDTLTFTLDNALADSLAAGQVVSAPFTVTVQDGANTDSAQVSFTIDGSNDAPIVPAAGSASTGEDQSLVASVSGSDVDGDALTYAVVAGPAHGALSLAAGGGYTYSPDANYNGTDSFSFKANDGDVDSNTGVVSLTVTPVDDAPVAANGSASGVENASIAGALSASDVEGDPLSFALVAGPTHGSVAFGSGGAFTYTPDAGYFGPDSFTFKANDGQLDSNVATESLTIASGNRPPSVSGGAPSAVLAEAGVGTAGVSSSTVAMAKSDPDTAAAYDTTGWTSLGAGKFSMAGVYGAAVLDTAADTLTYTLNNGLAATNALAQGSTVADAFTVAVTDGSLTASTPVTFSITGTDDPPVAQDDSVGAVYAAPLSIAAAGLLSNDTDPEHDALGFAGASGAQHGTLQVSGSTILFTPFVGFAGLAGFDYSVSDGHGGADIGHVTVNVAGPSPSYINRANISTSETIDTTGDASAHSIVTGSGADLVLTGSGGGSVRLGAGDDTVIGGAGKDTITFGPGLGTVTGGAGPDAFVLVKGQIVSAAAHGGHYDTITDFAGAGAAYAPGRDFIYLKAFSNTATITYEHDLAGDPTAHLYRVDDGAYSGEFVLQYAGAGVNLNHAQYGFL